MTQKLLVAVALLALTSCVKEEVKPYDFSCVVNGRSWLLNNPSIRIFKSDYSVLVSHDYQDSSGASLDVYADAGKEVVLSDLHIDINDFKGAATYTNFDAHASAIGERSGNVTTFKTYVIDNSKPKKVVIQNYQKGSNVKGIFTLTLKPEWAPDGDPESITVSYGRFDCPDRFWF